MWLPRTIVPSAVTSRNWWPPIAPVAVVTVPATGATTGVPRGASRSVPSWDRPPERGKPQSFTYVAPATGHAARSVGNRLAASSGQPGAGVDGVGRQDAVGRGQVEGVDAVAAGDAGQALAAGRRRGCRARRCGRRPRRWRRRPTCCRGPAARRCRQGWSGRWPMRTRFGFVDAVGDGHAPRSSCRSGGRSWRGSRRRRPCGLVGAAGAAAAGAAAGAGHRQALPDPHEVRVGDAVGRGHRRRRRAVAAGDAGQRLARRHRVGDRRRGRRRAGDDQHLADEDPVGVRSGRWRPPATASVVPWSTAISDAVSPGRTVWVPVSARPAAPATTTKAAAAKRRATRLGRAWARRARSSGVSARVSMTTYVTSATSSHNPHEITSVFISGGRAAASTPTRSRCLSLPEAGQRGAQRRFCSARRSASRRSSDGSERVVDVAHHLGHGVVAGLLGDEAVHLLGHDPVGGVALGRRAQLDEVHRLPGVQVEHEAHLVGEAHGVAGLLPGTARARSSCSAAERSMASSNRSATPASSTASGRV